MFKQQIQSSPLPEIELDDQGQSALDWDYENEKSSRGRAWQAWWLGRWPVQERGQNCCEQGKWREKSREKLSIDKRIFVGNNCGFN